MIKTQRNLLADYLKALAILGVVWIHEGVPGHYYFRFCVPAFVAVWAYYYESSSNKIPENGKIKFYIRRFYEYIIPYSFWTLVYISITLIHVNIFKYSLFTILFGQMGGFGFPGQYFFIILIQFVFVHPILERFISSQVSALIFISTTLAFNWVVVYHFHGNDLFEKIGFRPFIYWLPYYFLGIALSRGYLDTPPLATLLVAALTLPFIPSELSALGAASCYTAPSISIFSMCLVLLCLSDRAIRQFGGTLGGGTALGKILAYVGQNSFPIFLSNYLFIMLFKKAGLESISRLLIVILTIAAGLALGELSRRTGLGALVGQPSRGRPQLATGAAE